MDEILQHTMTAALTGRVVETVGDTAAVANFPAPVGAVVEVERVSGGPTEGEVIGFRENLTLVFLFTGITGVRHGNRVCLTRTARSLRVGPNLLGRVVDAHGNPIDGRPRPMLSDLSRLDRRPPLPTERPPHRYTALHGYTSRRHDALVRPWTTARHLLRGRALVKVFYWE